MPINSYNDLFTVEESICRLFVNDKVFTKHGRKLSGWSHGQGAVNSFLIVIGCKFSPKLLLKLQRCLALLHVVIKNH